MKWTYSIENKLTASAVLLFLCVVILFNNYNDRVHSKKVKALIGTMYADRIVAQDLIFKMVENLYMIKSALRFQESAQANSNEEIGRYISDINSKIQRYEETRLTDAEVIKFNQFKSFVHELSEKNKADMDIDWEKTDVGIGTLNDLADIQLQESGSILRDAEKNYRLIRLSSEFAFGLVLIILIIIQALVFSSKTLQISNRDVNAHMN